MRICIHVRSSRYCLPQAQLIVLDSRVNVRTAVCLLAQLRTELGSAGLTPSRRTHELLTRSYIVRRDVAAMLASLKVSLAATSASGSGEKCGLVLHPDRQSA